MPHTLDLELNQRDIAGLTSCELIAGFLAKLGYNTSGRKMLTPEALGLTGDTAAAAKKIEILFADDFFRVLFVQSKSLTAKARTDLVRLLGRSTDDHLLILTADFSVLEFVVIDKRKRETHGPGSGRTIQAVPLVVVVNRKDVAPEALKAMRGMTWTTTDGLEQFSKLRIVFERAGYSSRYFQNRLFSGHYLVERLPKTPEWSADNPSEPFRAVRDLLRDARTRFVGNAEKPPGEDIRAKLFNPILRLLGFTVEPIPAGSAEESRKPDYLLKGPSGTLAAAFCYQWERLLDASDPNDVSRPNENPGAGVVAALDAEPKIADWIIVSNGRYWRLYSRRAHSRATNYYEVDLLEALAESGDTDPSVAFRYWWLFFRPQAFRHVGTEGCRLDGLLQLSREFAKKLEQRLKDRIFESIFPHLAQGFLLDRKRRLGITRRPTDEELKEVFEATLTLLYRLLFLLYAEARDLLPVNEAAYREAGLRTLKGEIAAAARDVEGEVEEKLRRAFTDKETALYDRLGELFRVLDQGDNTRNVPTYNGGLFVTKPGKGDGREHRIARFLLDHRVPDCHLALAIDRLARDVDEKTFGLVFIDYKDLGVENLGSIYEGLLEFKLRVADEDLTTQVEDRRERFIPLSQAKPRRGKAAAVVVRKGEVYLSNDKAERKATGSYYTPEPIVKYIIAQTVGPVLDAKLEALRPEFRKVRKEYDRHLGNARAAPHLRKDRTAEDYAAAETAKSTRDLFEKVFDFRVLDPAMGSGHFLVEAVDFITDRLLTFLAAFPVNPVELALRGTRATILEALNAQGVTVDSDKLTDVNLLKRHVLKRCIYGVDLNPMAVELAKVSLWLDAFTLGAPLSFLDHHLRCGNSLIGASFRDLEEATKGDLFSVDYEPLLRAINHVLFVNKIADATASEVKKSTDEYDIARKELSGYQIVLDLLVARHFGFERAPDLLSLGRGLDLSSGDKFRASLARPAERKLVDDVEALARRADRRFFHWEIEFPEVFFDFEDVNQRRIKHKNEIAPGSAGFDTVVGNPPYDELSEFAAGHELPEKDFFKAVPLYKDALGGRLNIFRPFILRSLSVLRECGRHSFIVPMSLLADQFTAALRRRLLTEGYLRSIAAFPQKDDPHNRIFFEAKLSTCVYVAEKRPDHEAAIRIQTFPGKSLEDDAKFCQLTVVELRELDPDGLSLASVADSDIRRWKVIQQHPKVARWSEIAKCYLGEVMTNAATAHLTSPQPIGPRLLRGANINYYVLLDEPKQGEPLYLREKEYLKEFSGEVRSSHHKVQRVGFQESCPIDNWRRLIACLVPSGHYCVHKIRYFAPDANYDLHAILAIFNSAMPDWRFSLTSTNNSVNAYEVDALPIPRFSRLKVAAARRPDVDWERWDGVLKSSGDAGVTAWESTVLTDMKSTPTNADVWPDTIHDALAAAGKEMSRLGEERQRMTEGFASWLISWLKIDEDKFSGMTYIKGGQATFDQMGWAEFLDLLTRNRRSCGIDPTRTGDAVEREYGAVIERLKANRIRFAALAAAIDRVVWQLVGLGPDGNLPK